MIIIIQFVLAAIWYVIFAIVLNDYGWILKKDPIHRIYTLSYIGLFIITFIALGRFLKWLLKKWKNLD